MLKTITITECADFLRAHDDYLVLTHRRPDGDAVGSGGGLVRILKKLGKTAYLFRNPEITDKYMEFADGLFAPDGYAYKTVVSVDCASVQQLCEGAGVFAESIDLSIDHHASNTQYAKTLCYEDRAACGEIVYGIAAELGTEIDKDTADALYTAVSTDTGCFGYGNVTANSFFVASRLAEAGADIKTLNKVLFKTKTRSRASLDGYLYSTMNYYYDGRVAVAKIGLDVREKLGLTEDDMDSIAALPAEVEGVLAGVTIKEQKGGAKISLRTDGTVNSSDVCAAFGGGGHLQAAGCTIDGTMEEAEAALVREIGKVLS